MAQYGERQPQLPVVYIVIHEYLAVKTGGRIKQRQRVSKPTSKFPDWMDSYGLKETTRQSCPVKKRSLKQATNGCRIKARLIRKRMKTMNDISDYSTSKDTSDYKSI